jgi:glycosyltransferase involved in cell wall biosynthesis
MPKVLFASHDAQIGGAQNVLHSLVLALRERDVTPLVVYPSDGPGLARSREAGIETRVLPMEWWTCVGHSDCMDPLAGFLKGLGSRVEAIAELIEHESVDVVFTNTAVILEPALAARLTRRPHIWHILEMLSKDAELCCPTVGAFAKRVIGETAQRVVAVSEAVRAELADHVAAERLQVIHTGIDVSCFAGEPVPGERTRLLFVGQFSARKGIQDLFRAMALVFEADPNIDLYLAGLEVPHKLSELMPLVPEAHHGRVHYLGFRKDIPELLRSAAALALPSYADPLPVSVLEAMAAGLPVIGTRSGGMEDQIVDGQTGRLVPVGRPDLLASAVREVLSDRARARAMGEAGRRRAESEFSLEHMADEFAKVIGEVCREKLKPISQSELANTQSCLNMLVSFGSQLAEQAQTVSGLEHVAKLLEAERESLCLQLRETETYLKHVQSQRDALDNELTACRQERERYKVGLEMLMNTPYVRAGRAVKSVFQRLMGRRSQGE